MSVPRGMLSGMDVLRVVAAAVVDRGRLLVVSKQAAPDVFYLPGGKPEAGEEPEETLARELAEELGVTPARPGPARPRGGRGGAGGRAHAHDGLHRRGFGGSEAGRGAGGAGVDGRA